MKRTVLAILLAYALAAGAQDATQSQNPPAAGGASSADQAPTIKDPAEYNEYVSAVNEKANQSRAAKLEMFLKDYPNSVARNLALQNLLSTYKQLGNQAKVAEISRMLEH